MCMEKEKKFSVCSYSLKYFNWVNFYFVFFNCILVFFYFKRKKISLCINMSRLWS